MHVEGAALVVGACLIKTRLLVPLSPITLEKIGVGGVVLNPSGSRCIGEDEKRYEDKVG